jgi:hypothetical protein
MVTLFVMPISCSLIRRIIYHLDTVLDRVWHKHVPLKVSICVWRLSRNILPTKDNLVRCDIISPVDHIFVLVVAVKLNQLSICSFIAIYSVLFESKCGRGFVFTRWILIILWIIKYSSLTPQKVLMLADFFLQLLWVASVLVLDRKR